MGNGFAEGFGDPVAGAADTSLVAGGADVAALAGEIGRKFDFLGAGFMAGRNGMEGFHAGHANGAFKQGYHHAYESGEVPLANLYVSMLQAMGVESERFADSTGTLDHLT